MSEASPHPAVTALGATMTSDTACATCVQVCVRARVRLGVCARVRVRVGVWMRLRLSISVTA